jgi:ParB family transcriptional regulator, chromosome partitioning protein
VRSEETYAQVSVQTIREPTKAHRASMDPDRLAELIDDIAANGLLQPIGLVPDPEGDSFELIWGHRRLLAVRRLGWDVVTARVFPPGTDPLQARLSENAQRADLTPIEEANIVAELAERGEPEAEIARRFRRSKAWVRERAALIEYPDELRAAIHEKHIPLAVAHQLANIDHESYRRELIAEAMRTGANAATAAAWVAHYEAERPLIITNQTTTDQLRQGRDEYIVRHRCPIDGAETRIEATRLFRVCARCAKRIEAMTTPEGARVD